MSKKSKIKSENDIDRESDDKRANHVLWNSKIKKFFI
jgi:hypothetical protein